MIAAVLSFECVKICSAVVCREDVWAASGRRGASCPKVSSREAKYSRSWAASAEKKYRLPKSKLAGSQYKPTKSKWAYPVYIKKNQRELAEKLAQREITEMNLKNAGLRTG